MDGNETELNISQCSSGNNTSDHSDDESTLQIVVESPRTPKKKKKHKIIEFDDGKLDKTIEEMTDKCKNFTPDVAKKILMKLVMNEHILALSLLKAEEEADKERRKSSESEEDGTKSEPEAPPAPKLTRLKAKQLNTTLPVPGSLKNIPPNEEVVALIREDMRSDDEDEEYQPCEEDAMSDEEFTNTTFSDFDLDSQPSTPGSALVNHDTSPAKSGEFKIPKLKLTQEEQENIARRTRSKKDLTTTPIETIQSTFIPPDVPMDLYDCENELEEEWKDFLKTLDMPLQNNDDDDAEDPEYIAKEDPIDKEELRQVRVSKKEVNQLISELLDGYVDFMDLDDEIVPSTSKKLASNESSVTKKTRGRNASPVFYLKSPRIASKINDEMLCTPPLTVRNENIETTPNLKSDESFIQRGNQFVTPQKNSNIESVITTNPITNSSPIIAKPQEFQEKQNHPQLTPFSSPNTSFPKITGVYGSCPPQPLSTQQQMTPNVLVVNSQNQLELVPPSSIFNQAFNNNGIVQLPQFQSIVVQVPTLDLLQNRINLSNLSNNNVVTTASNSENLQQQPEVLEIENPNMTDDTKIIHRDVTKKKEKFSEFKDLESCVEMNEINFPEDSVGFTQHQFKIYEQQMRIHSQLLVQNYMQVFSHPMMWTKAEKLKDNLMELRSFVKPDISIINSQHIENCIETCESWEKELEEKNERNKNYAEFLYAEVEFDEIALANHKNFIPRFHPRLMEHILNSKAIIYPSLLPVKPFRCVKFGKIEPPSSELVLWAFEIAKVYPEIHRKVNRNAKRKKDREPTLAEIASELLHILGQVRKEKRMIRLLEKYKSDTKMNPIKFVFKHKKYFNYEHKLEELDLNRILPPVKLRRGLLPRNWDAYMFDHSRLEKYPYQPEYEDGEENVIEINEISEIGEEINAELEKVEKIITINDKHLKINISYPKIESYLSSTPEKSFEVVSCKRLLSPVQSNERSVEDKQRNLTSILKKVTNNLEKSPGKRKSVNFILPAPSEEKFVIPWALSQKFFIVVENFFSNYTQNFKFKRTRDNLLPKVFIWIQSFDIYIQLLSSSIQMSKKKTNEGDNIAKARRNVSIEEFTNRLKKRLEETRNLIMQTDKNKCTVEKDCSFSYNYLERVKIALMENGDDDLFTEFMTTLRRFDPNVESVPDLYHKIESMFMPNYADLVDLFITFLLPEHAAEVGKFFEHFVLNNMQNLIKKLNVVFSKHPQHIKKILVCLNELSNERDVTLETLKQKLFPLLKGNQLLIDWFMQLFDKPPTCPLSEYEVVNVKKSLSDDSSEDSFEEIPSTDLIECANVDDMKSCGVRYRNGKIYYYCGTLLPAKISFLANGTQIPPSTLPKIENSLCVHEIRKHVTFIEQKKLEETNENLKKLESKKKKRKDKNEKKEKVKKKPKLCDVHTLHAHAVRLNPVHAQNGEKLGDLIHYLTPSLNDSGEKTSPKKARNSKKNGNSPKKCNKSPTAAAETTTIASPPSPSKTQNIAKKIKIEETSASVSEEPVKKKVKINEEMTIPRVTTTIVSAEKSSFSSKKSRSENQQQQPSTSKKDAAKASDRSSESWTRDEDKIILEEIKIGYDDKDKLFDVLLTKLKRSRTEIRLRYDFLIDLVMMMN